VNGTHYAALLNWQKNNTMNLDRVVVTTFPGYFFSTALCLQSINTHIPDIPIDVVVDDFDLDQWPSYVDDCQQYLTQLFPNRSIEFYRFSQLEHVNRACAGGWFRQQLIKLHLDLLIPQNHWLLIDADVVLLDSPDLTTVPVMPHSPAPIDFGNRSYVQRLLNTPRPWLGEEHEFLCASGIPVRYISRDLLIGLRQHVESVHCCNFLDLHLRGIASQDIVAFDPDGVKPVMSEFQLIEVYRNQYHTHPIPLRRGANNFLHTSIKDWNLPKGHFASVPVPDQFWNNVLDFSSSYI
jgi:hypothetical protein